MGTNKLQTCFLSSEAHLILENCFWNILGVESREWAQDMDSEGEKDGV